MGGSGFSLGAMSAFLEAAKRRYASVVDAPGDEALGTGAQRPPVVERVVQDHPAVQSAPVDLEASWLEAERVFREGETVQGIVAGWNRGGLLVRWDRLQGFVPTSQLSDIPVFEDDELRDEKLASWVGEVLRLRVIELDRSRNRLVLSERATAWGPKDGERLMSVITPGETRIGYVSNICDFGAFVDLGGIDGLIHISELSWGRVTHPGELLSIGQRVEVSVLAVDKENGRVALSTKRLRPNPWATVDERYGVGQTTEAIVTNVVDFGAFAQLEEGLEGLIHISEMSEAQVEHPSDVVSSGDHVLVRILRIDSANHRLGLSMTQAHADDADEEEAEVTRSDWGGNPALLY